MYPQEFFIRHGRKFTSKRRLSTKEIEELEYDVKYINATIKNCYYNSAMLVLSDPEKYTYVEGYITSKGLPTLPHAWVIDKKGRVIDITLQIKSKPGTHEKLISGKSVKSYDPSNNVLGKIPEGWEYFGVPIQSQYLMSSMSKHEISPPLLDYTHGYDILKLSDEQITKEVLVR